MASPSEFQDPVARIFIKPFDRAAGKQTQPQIGAGDELLPQPERIYWGAGKAE
jgi:hypothetical protein